jgi:hypothetical protein
VKAKAGATSPIKIALADVNGTRISDAEAAALASACRRSHGQLPRDDNRDHEGRKHHDRQVAP